MSLGWHDAAFFRVLLAQLNKLLTPEYLGDHIEGPAAHPCREWKLRKRLFHVGGSNDADIKSINYTEDRTMGFEFDVPWRKTVRSYIEEGKKACE